MQSLKDRLTSRKFLVALGAALVAIGACLQGQIDVVKLVDTLTVIAVGYGVAEGVADHGRGVGSGG